MSTEVESEENSSGLKYTSDTATLLPDEAEDKQSQGWSPGILELEMAEGTPLLSAKEELKLGEDIYLGAQAIQFILRNEEADPVKIAKWESHISRRNAAISRLCSSNVRLVTKLARRMNKSDLSVIDRVGWGNIGLVIAAEGYDFRRRARFSTHAGWWIEKYIRIGSRDTGKFIRSPGHVYEKFPKILAVQERLADDLGREPLEEELAAELNMSVEILHAAFRARRDPSFFSYPKYNNGESSILDSIGSSEPTPENWLIASLTREAISVAITTLTPIERAIALGRLAQPDKDRTSLSNIGKRFNVSREWVRLVEKDVIAKLRALLAGWED